MTPKESDFRIATKERAKRIDGSRKDFAYRYILLIQGKQPAFESQPADRDREIESLKRSMDVLK